MYQEKASSFATTRNQVLDFLPVRSNNQKAKKKGSGKEEAKVRKTESQIFVEPGSESKSSERNTSPAEGTPEEPDQEQYFLSQPEKETKFNANSPSFQPSSKVSQPRQRNLEEVLQGMTKRESDITPFAQQKAQKTPSLQGSKGGAQGGKAASSKQPAAFHPPPQSTSASFVQSKEAPGTAQSKKSKEETFSFEGDRSIQKQWTAPTLDRPVPDNAEKQQSWFEPNQNMNVQDQLSLQQFSKSQSYFVPTNDKTAKSPGFGKPENLGAGQHSSQRADAGSDVGNMYGSYISPPYQPKQASTSSVSTNTNGLESHAKD